MKKSVSGLKIAILFAAGALLASCAFIESLLGSSKITSITASSGTLSQSGDGTWSFDAGQIPLYATENTKFTVKNDGAPLTAQLLFDFSNGDFTSNVKNNFTVDANSSNSFIGSFTPTANNGLESGQLTISAANGNSAFITLQGTPDLSFTVVDDATGAQVTNTSKVSTGCTETFTITNNDPSAVITMNSNPMKITHDTGGVFNYNNVQPSPTTINPSSSSTFTIGANGGEGDTATVSIDGVDSIDNSPFTFSFTIVSNSGGC